MPWAVSLGNHLLPGSDSDRRRARAVPGSESTPSKQLPTACVPVSSSVSLSREKYKKPLIKLSNAAEHVHRL